MELLPSPPLPAVFSYWVTMAAFSSLLILYCREQLDKGEKRLTFWLAALVGPQWLYLLRPNMPIMVLFLLVFSDIFYSRSDFYDL